MSHTRLRQREVEVLGVDLAALGVDPGQPVGEGKIGIRRGDPAGGEELSGKAVEDARVFLDDRSEVVFGVKQTFDNVVPLFLEMRDLLRGQRHHATSSTCPATTEPTMHPGT